MAEPTPPTHTHESEHTLYQTPEWETRTCPQRRSLLGRLLPASSAGVGAATTTPTTAGHHDVESATKERDAVGAHDTPHLHESTPATATAGAASGPASMQQRLDRILPPYRTYFGRSRRFLLLFILLPLAILLFVILPLAIGLGVGLSRHSSSGSSNLPLPSNTATFTGDLTYYEPGLGACGVTSTSEDNIVSVSHIIFDAASSGSNPNANPLCGRKIRIEREFNGGNSSVDVTVVDRCTGCEQADLDVSLGVFTQLALEENGRVQMSWAWLS
ncbi:putative RlpA-like protein double-psi beta-barrel domain-containing protein [Seiridium unicorne]|uniref:RlpA-like protein double-psi beta-barrel domain-containing protein n=1 Tax=Seiridium unicorne TaxID=138068 RepID=A0ABR2V938_9PEZI